MSRIYFRTQYNGKVELHGSERYHLKNFISDLFISSLAISYPFDYHPLSPFMPDWVNDDKTAKNYLAATCEEIGGFDLLELQINTAISTGNDILALGAYIHAGCETHGYFDPKDFDWLRKTIELGLLTGFYRHGQGWDAVLALANKATGPIVMSYSTSQSFPARADGWDDAFAEIEDVKRIFPPLKLVGHRMNGWQLVQHLISQRGDKES